LGILRAFFVFFKEDMVMELSLGEKIRIERTRQKMSQVTLAENIGTCQSRISRIESSIIEPQKEELLKIQKCFNLSFLKDD